MRRSINRGKIAVRHESGRPFAHHNDTPSRPRRVQGWGRGAGRLGRMLVVIVLAAVTGCGGGMPQVSGVVTLDGEPLATTESYVVRVSFSPTGEGAMAVATTDNSGRFQLSTGSQQGVVAGSYNASVVGMEIIPPPDEGAAPVTKRTTPARYANPSTSELTFEVKPGANSIEIPLVSGE